MARKFAAVTVLFGLAVGLSGCSGSSSPSKPPTPPPDVPGKDANTGARKIGPPQ